MSGMLLQSASPLSSPGMPGFLLCVCVEKELRALLLHERGYESTSTITRGGGIIITIKTIEAAEMSCLLQSMLNSLARGQAA